jgi:hypothetical protein
LNLKSEKWFQAVSFKFNLYRYNEESDARAAENDEWLQRWSCTS